MCTTSKVIVAVDSSSSCESQVEGLEAAVDSKDAELMALRKTLEHKEAQVYTAVQAVHALCDQLCSCRLHHSCGSTKTRSNLATLACLGLQSSQSGVALHVLNADAG